MNKEIFTKDLKEGDRFDDLFLVKSEKLGKTKAGKPYLVLTVMDKSGEISGPIWENAEQLQKVCVPGKVVRIRGTIQSYRDTLQLRVDDVSQVVQKDVDQHHFLPASHKDRRQMADALQEIVQSVENPFLRKLLRYFFDKSDWWPIFQGSPAAKGMHHAYLGGLLEHSLSVARVASFLAKHYEGIDRSLLIAGALLHDIGKLEELRLEAGIIDYTVRGRLKGHLVIGSEMVGQATGKIRDFPEELLEKLQHLILSHHGRQEFGSPVVPMMVEAFMLSFIDDLDAKMNITEQLRRKMEGDEMRWTDYQRSLERFLYLDALEKQETKAKIGPVSNMSRQPSLF